MSITSSTFAIGHAQADGSAYVVETHTDNIGIAHVVEYLAPAGTNYQAVMAARALRIAAELAENEASELLR